MKEFGADFKSKAMKAKSAEELYALVTAEGLNVTEDDAKRYYETVLKSGELSDEELDNVAGGGCGSKSGDSLVGKLLNGYACPQCHKNAVHISSVYGSFEGCDPITGRLGVHHYCIVTCSECQSSRLMHHDEYGKYI